MRRWMLVAGWVLGASLLSLGGAFAAFSNAHGSGTLAYEGFLERNGLPVQGSVDITFTLWSAATGGQQLWTETQPGVTVFGGRFSVRLGSVTPLGDDVAKAGDLFVALSLQGPGDSSPVLLSDRQQLTAAPFALSARQAVPGQRFDLGGPSGSYLVDGPSGRLQVQGANNEAVMLNPLGGDVVAAGGGGVLAVNPQDAAAEGGEIQLRGAAANATVALDNRNGEFRVFSGSSVKFQTSGNDLNVTGTLAAGKLAGPLNQASCYWRSITTCGHSCGNGTYFEGICDVGDYMVGLGLYTYSQYSAYNFQVRCCRP